MGTGVSPSRIVTGHFFSLLSNKDWLTHGPLLSFPLSSSFFRKEVIQPHLPIRLPCYDFTPVTCPAVDRSLPRVGSRASGVTGSHGVTGGVYKTRERIHRGMLIRDYSRFRLREAGLQASVRTET